MLTPADRNLRRPCMDIDVAHADSTGSLVYVDKNLDGAAAQDRRQQELQAPAQALEPEDTSSRDATGWTPERASGAVLLYLPGAASGQRRPAMADKIDYDKYIGEYPGLHTSGLRSPLSA